MSISIVIPAHNEAEAIAGVVTACKALPDVTQVIVVDDGSTDDTGTIARRAGAEVVTHPYCVGNGASVKSGARAATGDIVVFLDGDGQHPPEDVPRLVAKLEGYHLVVGAREPSTHANLKRRFGNNVYNVFASYVTQFPILDLTSGFRAIRRDLLLHYLYLLPNGFSSPSTLTLAILRTGRSLAYVPIRARERKGTSKIHLLKDGTRFFLIIIKIATLFSPLRVFIPVSLLAFILGTANYTYSSVLQKHFVFTNMSALLYVAAVLVFMLGLVAEQIAQLRLDRTEGLDTIGRAPV
ncbi:MAG: glycosyltransferase family 2 protein [bacterium]